METKLDRDPNCELRTASDEYEMRDEILTQNLIEFRAAKIGFSTKTNEEGEEDEASTIMNLKTLKAYFNPDLA